MCRKKIMKRSNSHTFNLSPVMYMNKVILIFFMKNVMSMLRIVLVICLNNILACLYMMNVRMATDASQIKDCNNGLDHQEEEEDYKLDTSLCFLDSEITLLDSKEKHNDICFETFVRNQVLNYESLDEEVNVSFANCQEHSLHGFLE